MDWSGIIVAVFALVGTLTGNILSSRKNKALIEYRMDKIEEKLDKHNNLVEKVYGLEKGLSEVCVRVSHLEGDKK